LKGVDCIATKDHKRFLQFQVKSSTKGTDYALFRIGQREDYYFVFHCVSTQNTWIIPAKDLARVASADTPIEKTGEKRYRIRLTKSKKGKPYPDPQYSNFQDEAGLRLLT
jgi:hypothetical protein